MTKFIIEKQLKIWSISVVLCICFLPFSSRGKSQAKIATQFNYTQIDSLVNTTIANLKIDSPSYVVANTMWYVGSYAESSTKFVTHRNHFDIYIIFAKKKKFYIQKIDNFSFFELKKIKGKEVQDYLMTYFYEMKKEQLKPKSDTVYNNEGKMLTLTTIVDHQLVRKTKIINAHDTLEYEYPSTYSANRKNLDTRKFKFFSPIDNVINQFNKKRIKRKDVVLGYDSNER